MIAVSDRSAFDTQAISRAASVLHDVRVAVPSWRASLRPGRRVDTPFAGVHRTVRIGSGDDHADTREYRIGDDPRHIDWAASARSATTQVRQTYADRGMRVTIVTDCSPSMRFGTSTLTKAELALATTAAFSLLATKQGDSVAAMLCDGNGLRWVPPGSGNAHVNVLLRTLESGLIASASVPFDVAINRAMAYAPTSGLLVAISDFHDDAAPSALRRFAATHRTLAVVVSDPREHEMVSVGVIDVCDPETGERYTVSTDDARVRAQFAATSARLRESRLAALRAAGVHVALVECGPLWLRSVEHCATGVLR